MSIAVIPRSFRSINEEVTKIIGAVAASRNCVAIRAASQRYHTLSASDLITLEPL